MFSLNAFQDAIVYRIKEMNTTKKEVIGVWCPHFIELKITWTGCRTLPHTKSVPGKAFCCEKLKGSELFQQKGWKRNGSLNTRSSGGREVLISLIKK